MEDIVYKLKVTSIKTLSQPLNGFLDVIAEIDWEITALITIGNETYGGIGSDRFIVDVYNLELNTDTFVKYESLTEDIIVSWLEQNDPKISKMKERLKNNLYSTHFFPLKSSPLPWVNSENSNVTVESFITGNPDANGNYAEFTSQLISEEVDPNFVYYSENNDTEENSGFVYSDQSQEASGQTA